MLGEVSLFALVGFVAQLIDGAIGMAYGLAATSVLLSVGVTPATASASVHAAEIFTTGASGLAHWRLGNVRRDLVLRLAVSGALGGVPRTAIGSASLAEFFVTASISAAFFAPVGLSLWPIVAGLVVGGVLAAPLAAYVAQHVPARPLMVVVGIVVSMLALRTLVISLRPLLGAA